jgi:hypothetical protein
MGKRQVTATKWTAACPEDIVRPKKPQRLAVALSYLGPFTRRSEAAAIRDGLVLESNGKTFGISEELARKRIEQAATEFNRSEYLSRNAPRFSHLARTLEELIAAADALREKINDLGFFELRLLHHIPDSDSRWAEYAIKAKIEGLPLAYPKTSTEPCLWVEQLESLSRYVKAKVRKERQSRRVGGRSDTDKGGNTNFWKEVFGTPVWNLVSDALMLFEIFKPGQAAGTEGGPFHQFVLAIFEFATGKQGEDHANLYDWIKKLVKPSRLDRELETEQRQLIDEEIAIFDTRVFDNSNDAISAPTDQQNARIREISLRLEEIHRRRWALWKLTWPHVRLGDLPR